jgi:hypothetical protein
LALISNYFLVYSIFDLQMEPMIINPKTYSIFASSSIGSENSLNMYLNFTVHGSIFTEGKNSTREGGDEDREVAVSELPNARTVTATIFDTC